MKENIKNFFSNEKKLAKTLVAVLALIIAGFSFGPSIYAEFTKYSGTSQGWGYGWGYGYGASHGNDLGQVAGYRNDFTYKVSQLSGYGWGYGYMSSNGLTYDASGYHLSGDYVANLGLMGLIYPRTVGGSLSNTTKVTFSRKVYVSITGGATITIPLGTTLTADTGSNFSTITASPTVSTADLTTVTSVGAVQFGLPSTTLTLNQAITIAIPVSTQYNNQTLTVYYKDSGSWTSQDACTISAGVCTFTTTHLSSFAVTKPLATTGGNNTPPPSSPSSPSYTPPAPTPTECSNVVYSNWGSCVSGNQLRSITSQTPAGCALTVVQSNAVSRSCEVITNADGQQEIIPVAPAPVVTRDLAKEKLVTTKYLNTWMKLNKKTTAANKDLLLQFTTYGTTGNTGLTYQQRAQLVIDFKGKYKRLPTTAKDWTTLYNTATALQTQIAKTAAITKFVNDAAKANKTYSAANKKKLTAFITSGTKGNTKLTYTKRMQAITSYLAAYGNKLPTTTKQWTALYNLANKIK